MNFRLLTTIAAAAATLAVALPAAAQDSGNFLVRVRATHLQSANSDETGLGLSINDKWIPELDLSYFITPNFAAELILTVPQKHTVHSSVYGVDIGSFKHLPPTLLAQYHFTNLPGFRPYVGAGVNYTNITGVDLATASAALNADVNLKRQSWGLAFQVGVDVPVGGGWLLNADVKKVQIATDVLANGNSAGKFKVDPLLVSFGVGKRF
jgi:outer membrane protein